MTGTSDESEESFVPGLYVVGTPIGNLGDLTPRAAAVLRSATIVAAEDTRTAGILLRLVSSKARAVSFTEHNVGERTPGLLKTARDSVVALVSEAGTPAIADPGARLVEAAHLAGVRVVAIPGPSALAAALSVAGFDASDVRFLGFLPRPAGQRTGLLEGAADAKTLVFYESPRRLIQTLDEVAALFGDPEVAVCRELTKLHEEVVRGRASAVADRFREGVRGECTVVVRCPPARPGDAAEAARWMAAMQRAGARRSAAAAEVSRLTQVGRQRTYELWDESGS